MKKHKPNCRQPRNNYYWCPYCGQCYCQHRYCFKDTKVFKKVKYLESYGEVEYAWNCPDGLFWSLKAHVAAHKKKDLK